MVPGKQKTGKEEADFIRTWAEKARLAMGRARWLSTLTLEGGTLYGSQE
jgi:hypothetical protein